MDSSWIAVWLTTLSVVGGACVTGGWLIAEVRSMKHMMNGGSKCQRHEDAIEELRRDVDELG